ncbi:beta-ketoacyl synthase N-terminal-like domain-containing protein, partial [Nocardia sp. NPDC023852]|uniref:beta-ketoacyl synthase N-terminal-like domain-containing protein n=1 Tax=Nocardia sp. NPDC023852 TaxID=3154697 RepID=UPI0033E5D302
MVEAANAIAPALRDGGPRRQRGVPPDLTSGAIAIVGMSCRLPGAVDLAGFWRLLRGGRDGVGSA